MKSYDPSKPIISLHVPKCAGTSFNIVLRKWFGRKLFLHYHNEKKNKPPKSYKITEGIFHKKARKGICIHGHFNNSRGNGVNDYYPSVDQFISVIRDPIEIHLSNYFYLKKLGSKAYRNGSLLKVADPTYTIDDFFVEYPKSYLLSFFPIEIDSQNYCDVIHHKFVYICLAEDLQNSIDLLAYKIGKKSEKIPVSNISHRTEALSKKLKEKFIEENYFEFEIYNYVKKIYKTLV